MAFGAPIDEEQVLGYGASGKRTQMAEDQVTPLAPAPSSPQVTSETQASSHFDMSGYNEKADLLVNFAKATWADCKPWSEFYSTRAIAVPKFANASDRVLSNLSTFRANYMVVAALWLCLAMLTGIPKFLITMLLFVILEKWASRRAQKNGGVLSERDRVIIGATALLIVWMTHIVRDILISLCLTAISVGLHTLLHTEETTTDGAVV